MKQLGMQGWLLKISKRLPLATPTVQEQRAFKNLQACTFTYNVHACVLISSQNGDIGQNVYSRSFTTYLHGRGVDYLITPKRWLELFGLSANWRRSRILTRKTEGSFGVWAVPGSIRVDCNFHLVWSHGCCPVRAIGGAYCHTDAFFTGNQQDSERLMVFKVGHSLCPGGQHTLAFWFPSLLSYHGRLKTAPSPRLFCLLPLTYIWL